MRRRTARPRVSPQRRPRAPAGTTKFRPGSVWWTVASWDLERGRGHGASGACKPARLRGGNGDWVLLGAVGLLVALGILMVLDVTYFCGWKRYGDPFLFFRRHLLAVTAGGVGLIVASHMRLEAYRRFAGVFLAIAIVGLLLVLSPFGKEAGGAQRWIRLGGMSVQPSEMAKLALVFYLAWWLPGNRDRIRESGFALMLPLVLAGLIGALLLLEPDFGTTILVGVVFMTMLFMGDVPIRHLGVILLAAVPTVVGLVAAVEYRWDRLMSFLDPWKDPLGEGFQLIQSMIAFGSGGLTGLGLGGSRQKMFYLPEAHTDFMFSVIAEELGLIGALGVLVLFSVLGLRGARIAQRQTDPFGRLLAFGVTTLIALQAVVNTAVTVGLLPTKGLPLPFVSYGGSAMVAGLTAVGVLHGLSREVQ